MATAVTGVVEASGMSGLGGIPARVNVDVTLTFAADAGVPATEIMRAQNLNPESGCTSIGGQ
jgi:hypothetical protein